MDLAIVEGLTSLGVGSVYIKNTIMVQRFSPLMCARRKNCYVRIFMPFGLQTHGITLTPSLTRAKSVPIYLV